MRDHRADPTEVTDISELVRKHDGDGVIRASRTNRNRRKDKQAKASRRRNR